MATTFAQSAWGCSHSAFALGYSGAWLLEAEQGIHYEASGRRSGIKQLLANVVEALGPFWVTVIGVL